LYTKKKVIKNLLLPVLTKVFTDDLFDGDIVNQLLELLDENEKTSNYSELYF